ncbi:MAG: hypothetical protein ACMUHU_02080 [Thermoplasmatota archaeon]
MAEKQERKNLKKFRKEEGKLEDTVEYFSGIGHPHPVADVVAELRQMMLSSGFDEIQTSFFLPLKDVKQLTGELYPAFMDSIYHLSWIQLEPVPPNKEVELKLRQRFPDIDQAELWNILDSIDEDSSGEELLHTITEKLAISHQDAISIMNLIPELRYGETGDEDQTLRAFMPTSWISTLEATYDKEAFPIRLFTISPIFRREPYLDSRHIRTYNILSFAILDEDFDIEKGKRILGRVFDQMELEDVKMVEKPYPFPYFETGTEIEIFGGDLELGTCGMVSSEVLAERGINAPVFIADIGVERTLMYKHGYPDIRELFFPQFFAAWNLSDEEISSSIRYLRRPQTEYGKEIANAILKCYKDNAGEPEIKRKVAWTGFLVDSEYGNFLVSEERAEEMNITGTPVEVILKEAGSGHGIAGPAAFNEIWINDGNIVAAPPEMSSKMEEMGAFKTNKTFVKGFSRFAAWKIEKAIDIGHTSKVYEKVKDLEGINMKLTSKALQYILSHKKKVDIQGPVYLKFLMRLKGSDNNNGA